MNGDIKYRRETYRRERREESSSAPDNRGNSQNGGCFKVLLFLIPPLLWGIYLIC